MSVKQCSVVDLIKEWDTNSGRKEFIDNCLKKEIRESLNVIAKHGDKKTYGDGEKATKEADAFLEGLLDIRYSDPREKQDEYKKLKAQQGEKRPAKTDCRPILLLHNILAVLKIGKGEGENSKYMGQKSFYKFPFNLYNNEKWDVEHIAPQTENVKGSSFDRKEWLLSVWPYIKNEELKTEIESFFKAEEDVKNFEDLAEKCETWLNGDKNKNQVIDSDDDKNRIWNFVLLDAETNRSYKNALFPVKRRTIMFKEQGVKLKLIKPRPKDKDSEVFEVFFEHEAAESPFVPLCTKNVFLQYYTEQGASPLFWSRADAKAYKENILGLLKEFVFSGTENKLTDVRDGN